MRIDLIQRIDRIAARGLCCKNSHVIRVW
jgi:hypothetical protein